MLFSAALHAQQAGPITRVGTGEIAGVLVDAQRPPQPIPRAVVTLNGKELPTGRAVVTDNDGRFRFEQLPAGSFTMSSSKPAYLKATFGELRPGGAGTPIALSSGQRVTDLRITMAHGGAIAGTIRDQRGEPLPAMSMYAVPVNAAPGASVSRESAVFTDDRGDFRIFGLRPGNYVVMAMPPLSGTSGEIGQMSTAEIDAMFARLSSARPAAPTAPTSSAASVVRPTRTFTQAPTFYPGTVSTSEAGVITLDLGEERLGVDFVFQPARSVSVSGTLAGVESPSGVTVSIRPVGLKLTMPPTFGSMPTTQRGTSKSFQFTQVTSGRYQMTAQSGSGGVPSALVAGMPAANASSPAQPLFASAIIDVSGDEDVTGIVLTLQPAPHVSGRVAFDFATPDLKSTPNINVRLVSTTSTTTLGAVVKPDGTFSFAAVAPGSYRVITEGQPSSWRAKSAIVAARDVMDVPLEVGLDHIEGLAVTFSDKHSQVTGRLTRGTGDVASGYVVVALPADRALWLPQSRRLVAVRTATNGVFTFSDLPPGEYVLAALADVERDEWQLPEVLAQLAAAGVKITLGEGETKMQDLKIGG